jgi:AmmeMemoRadiSam system protein B
MSDDRPRLRPLDAFPVLENGQQHLALRDPSGLTEAVARLPPMVVAIVQLFDGETTRDQICAEYQQRYRIPLPREALDRIIEQLDQALLLDTERFRQHSANVFAEFARSPVRPAHLAGKSYPREGEALGQMLRGFYTHAHGPGAPGERKGAMPRAIVAPHIDFQRGGPAYAWAYKPLAEAAERPELVIVFGTDHGGLDEPITLTRKHYETPLGRAETDVALVDALSQAIEDRLGRPARERLFRDEHHHRGEHSLEFQMIWLRHSLPDHAFTVLPILCGSLHTLIEDQRHPGSDEHLGAFIETLRTLTQGRRVLWLAGADLAHVGPRFGDTQPLDENDRGSLERRDQATLEHCLRGDAPAWFDEIAREQDRRRVCGLTPIYAMLGAAQLASKEGRLAAYAQCPADEQGHSLVSIASLVWD